MTRLLELAGWLFLALAAMLLVTELAGWTGNKWVAGLQAAAPYVLAASMPLAAIAVVTQRWALGAVSAAVAVGFVVLAWPLLVPPGQPTPRAGADPLRIFHGNLFYENDRDAEIVDTLAGLDADVLVFTEYTFEHADALLASPLATEYPHRLGEPRAEAAGTAVWSRYPLVEHLSPVLTSRSDSVLATVAAPDPVLLLAVHPMSPIVWTNQWLRELAGLARWPVPAEPTVIIGDFNATYWHPGFRDVLDAGWRDAHQALGQGFSNSWPNNRWAVPTLVRLDHALVNDALVVTAVDDVDVPGSDHAGLVVTVTPAAG